MRIINLEANPRFLSFASPTFGGKSIQSGESSAEVPLDRIQKDIFKKELDAGKISIRFNEAELTYLNRLLKLHATPFKAKQLPPEPKPVKQVKKVAKPGPKKMIGGIDPGTPVSLDAGMSLAPTTGNPVTPENIKKGVVSLSDLQKQNRAPTPLPAPNEKASVQQIDSFLKSMV